MRGRAAVEEIVDGSVPQAAVRWPETDVVAGVTTRALDFGQRTDAAARAVDDAHATLRRWVEGRFLGIVGGSQIHGSRVFAVDPVEIPEVGERSGPFALEVAGYDGFVATSPGILLTVGVADCVPAFLVAPGVGAVALLHAGWRGVAGSILEAGLVALEEACGVEPAACRAHWGPAIGGCCYPVGEEVVEAIRATSAGPGTDGWVVAGENGPTVDLRGALDRQARAAGVPEDAISRSPSCTACEPDRFHSYRRAKGGGGRMIAFAGVPLPVPSETG